MATVRHGPRSRSVGARGGTTRFLVIHARNARVGIAIQGDDFARRRAAEIIADTLKERRSSTYGDHCPRPGDGGRSA